MTLRPTARFGLSVTLSLDGAGRQMMTASIDGARVAHGVVGGAKANALARGESVIKCPSPLNMLKDTYDHSCY